MNEPGPAASDPELYARSFADVYDDWYGDLDDPALLVAAFQRQVARPARVLELGGGTGRLASPLQQAGYDVLSLDISLPMLRASPPGVSCLVGDMARLAVRPSSVDAVLIAYNTLFNLASHEVQRACFAGVARVLRPGGMLAIEAFIAPETDGGGADSNYGVSMRDHPSDPASSLAIITGPDLDDPHALVGSHVEIRNGKTTCRPWRLVYQSPAQLDESAHTNGLVLSVRYADWSGAVFDPAGVRHVSWYQFPSGG